ncbi:MAG TPA: glycosyltransferase [Burkholderiales bacterium]|nr:glycosyltransferase [Burkholderiales bacterium]
MSTESPGVSVVMIHHQAERFIDEAIASVRAQTTADWELLVVDDGSTDGSAAIVARHAAEDPARVRALAHAGGGNRGMAAARNLGMTAARGSAIAFLDADDLWRPERLARHLAALEAHPAVDVVLGSTVEWRSWNPEAQRTDRVLSSGITPDREFDPPSLLALLLAPGLGALPGVCSVTLRRGPEVPPPRMPERFTGLFEDQCLFALLLAQRRAVVVDAADALYRQHPASHVVRHAPERAAEELRYLRWLDEYLRLRGIYDAALAAAIAARFAPHRRPVRTAVAGLPRRIARTAVAGVERVGAALLPATAASTLDRTFERMREALRRRRIRAAERRERARDDDA